MRQLNLIVLLLAISNMLLCAQRSVTQKDLLAITPLVSDELDIPSGARSILESKTKQMLSQNGLASLSERIILTPDITILSKEVAPTTPPMFSLEAEISFYVIDLMEGVIIHEITFSAKGINNQEHKALIQAINQINVRTPEVRRFVEESKTRLHEYYKARIPSLLSKANTFVSQGLYEDALILLSGIPETVEGYDAVAKNIHSTYKLWANHDADRLLLEAKALMATGDHVAAMHALSCVDPMSDRYKNADVMFNQIMSGISERERIAVAKEQQVYEDKKEAAQRAHDDNVMLAKMAIQATQQVATAYVEVNQISIMKKLNNWVKSKLR
ncbi:hypothetical protein LJC35_03885 [Parabacteroides sp. OttesenSCG-928-N08]|nr:hypothetical protein [Parabacteroides sp. OttesenSCG-928-N08]